MRRLILACSVLAILGSAACSSEADNPSDGSGGSGNGSLDDKQVSQLTAAEATALCQDNADSFDTLVDVACTAQAWITAGDAAMCATVRQQCIDDPAVNTLNCMPPDPADVANCPFTVGQLEQCLAEVLSFAPNVKCDAEMIPDPPECARTILDQCVPEMPEGS